MCVTEKVRHAQTWAAVLCNRSVIWSIKRLPEITTESLFLVVCRCSVGGGLSFCPWCVHVCKHSQKLVLTQCYNVGVELQKSSTHWPTWKKEAQSLGWWVAAEQAATLFSPVCSCFSSNPIRSFSLLWNSAEGRGAVRQEGHNVATGRRGFTLGTNWGPVRPQMTR